MRTIYFDMDGTIADFYGVNGWLDYLIARETTPYEEAKPLLFFSLFARLLNNLQRKGYRIGIISWLAKNSDYEFDEAVRIAKLNWLKTHLPSVHFDEIHIVAYGTPKESFSKNEMDILFDDEKQNRENWNGISYDVQNIIEILRAFQECPLAARAKKCLTKF